MLTFYKFGILALVLVVWFGLIMPLLISAASTLFVVIGTVATVFVVVPVTYKVLFKRKGK